MDDRELIKNRLKELRKKRNANLKEKYKLARSLGISSEEATQIASWSDERIRKYAERD